MCAQTTQRLVVELDVAQGELTMWRAYGEDQAGEVVLWNEEEVGPFDQAEARGQLATATLRILGALWFNASAQGVAS